MNAPVETLAFARSFEKAGFGHERARALASAFGKTREASREDIVTRDVLNAELSDTRIELKTAAADLRIKPVREIATAGKDVNGRLWSTVTIIAGVSTAISAVVGGGRRPAAAKAF